MELKYFKPEEFEKCVPKCSIEQMDSSFLLLLDKCRELAGVPFIITSAYRSRSWDKERGRTGNGYHTKGRAVDVVAVRGEKKRSICAACHKLGLTYGVYGNFIHIDDRDIPIVFHGR